jgi:hypothetical protein
MQNLNTRNIKQSFRSERRKGREKKADLKDVRVYEWITKREGTWVMRWCLETDQFFFLDERRKSVIGLSVKEGSHFLD